MSSYKKFTKDIGMMGLVNLTIFLRGLIILPIITKLLGAANYGVWTQLGVTVSLITPLALLGLPLSLVRFLAVKRERKEIQEGIYSVLIVISVFALILILPLIIFSKHIADFFQTQPILIQILALVIFLECLITILLSLFQAVQEIGKYSYFLIFKTFGEVGLIIGAVLSGYGLYGAVLSLLIIRIITFLILFCFVMWKFGLKFPAFSKIKEYLNFGVPTVASNISYWTITSSDRYLIGFFLGVLFVGYYAPAYTIGNLINFLIYPLAFMLPPVLSKLFDENKLAEVKNYLKYSLKYFLMFAVPMAFGLSILSKQLLTIFSTPEIAENGYFITPFVVLSILLKKQKLEVISG